MDLSIIGEPHYPLLIKKDALESVEQSLLALTDFLVSSAIKTYNQSLTLADKHIVLAHGGKAFSEYVEKIHRPDSYDWDVKIFADNSTPPDKLDILSKTVVEKLADLINIKLSRMNTVSCIVKLALMRAKKSKGFSLDLTTVNDYKINANFGRRKAVAGGIVDYVCFTVKDISGNANNITSVLETWPILESPSTIISYFNAMKNCNIISGILLDKKRFYVPLTYLVDNIKKMTVEPTYPKKDKALLRLQIISDAIQYDRLTVDVVDKKCNIVFDFTGNYINKLNRNDFQYIKTIEKYNIDEDYTFLSNNKVLLDSIKTYSGDAYRDIGATLLYSYFYKKTFQQTWDENPSINRLITEICITNLDKCFDIASKRNIPLSKPLVVFRNTGFVALAIQNSPDATNLYEIKPGLLLKNVVFTSTTYSNRNRSIASFADDSQFKGCMFKITIKSTEGIIIIDKHSKYASEEEVLLDRRGSLYITNVSYAYTVETCGTNNRHMERLYIEADYYPRNKYPASVNLVSNVSQSPIKPVKLTDEYLESILFAEPCFRHDNSQETSELREVNRDTIRTVYGGYQGFDNELKFTTNSPMGIVNNIRQLFELKIESEDNFASSIGELKSIDTVLGTINVEKIAYDELIGERNSTFMNIPIPFIKKISIIIAIAILLVIIVLICYYTFMKPIPNTQETFNITNLNTSNIPSPDL